MKKIMKAISITAGKVWGEIGGPVLGMVFGLLVAALFCITVTVFVKFPLISICVVAVILILWFIHSVSATYRSIDMDDFNAN